MTPPAPPARYKNQRFPGAIIRHGVWLHYRFTLSFRDVEAMLCAQGIVVTYEAIRQWCRKGGQAYATQLRRRRPRPGDTWYLDEVFLTIHGKRHSLWRAVDQDDNVLDSLVQSRHNKKAAKKFFRLKTLTMMLNPGMKKPFAQALVPLRSSIGGRNSSTELIHGRKSD